MEEQQLKFISSLFKMSLKEFDRVMGPESIQTIFRLIGETQGEAVEQRMKKRYKISKWDPKKFAETFVKDVLEPALGEGNAEYVLDGASSTLTLKVKACPFLRAGMGISDRHFCNYTEGLIETAAKMALGNIEFIPEDSIAKGGACGIFKIKF